MAQAFKGQPPSDDKLDGLIAQANEPEDVPGEPLAIAAAYDAVSRRITVELDSGATFIFPVDRLEGLANQPDAYLTDLRVMPGGDGLGWPSLDIYYHVGSLVVGTFGGKSWMRQLRQALARDAGSATSVAKAIASRENGKKGGRPRKAIAELGLHPARRLS